MTRDEIIKMAAEIWNAGSSFPIPSSDDVLRFAALVAAAEREACAKACEAIATETYGMTKLHEYGECAYAIRARGQA